MSEIESFLQAAVGIAWGPPLVVLLLGGGLVLTLMARLLPLLGLPHGLQILRGRFDRQDDPGEITHFQALSTALSSTIGMGNIGGVAVAITQGGPGAVFWMWVAAFVGMATKFFSCTLAVMYRGRDSAGQLQGGPMYVIDQALGPRFKPLAVLFAVCGTIGCLPLFQTNQMAEILVEAAAVPRWLTGVACTALAAVVIVGGVQRIAAVASRLVPAMCFLYLLCALGIALQNLELLPAVFASIVRDAFTGTAAVGGFEGVAVAAVIQTGVKRAVFSNEAGLGTAPMAHGAARTTEPVREGLVAMIGPAVDTLLVCSLTAFIILSTGGWQVAEVQGVALTLGAFQEGLGSLGTVALLVVVALFGMTTVFGYAYYSRKCFCYLFGAHLAGPFNVFFVAVLTLGAVWSAATVVNLIDLAFALMAVPNMITTLLLAPRVVAATRDYLARSGIRVPLQARRRP